jgi:hypothetical protein
MTWFHAPLISPAVGFYCLIGVVVIASLFALVQRERTQRTGPDPFSKPFGDQ